MSDGIGEKLEKAALSAIREQGMIIVPASPTGAMIKAAYKIAPSLSAEQVESIYFLMTNAWLAPPAAESLDEARDAIAAIPKFDPPK